MLMLNCTFWTGQTRISPIYRQALHRCVLTVQLIFSRNLFSYQFFPHFVWFCLLFFIWTKKNSVSVKWLTGKSIHKTLSDLISSISIVIVNWWLCAKFFVFIFYFSIENSLNQTQSYSDFEFTVYIKYVCSLIRKLLLFWVIFFLLLYLCISEAQIVVLSLFYIHIWIWFGQI